MMASNNFPIGAVWHQAIGDDAIAVRQDGVITGEPIILIHAFAGSLQQWDEVALHLSQHHWVIRVDLLGHGRSDKPTSGYSMPDQAARVAELATVLGATSFFSVGQSGGSNVVVALMDDPRHGKRLKGALLIAAPPNMSFVDLPAIANIYGVPLVGRLVWAITSRKMVSDTMANLFAPDFGVVPDVVVDDFFAMTRASYVSGKRELEGFATSKPLSERVTNSGVPVHVVFGEQDQWIPAACVEQWQKSTHASVQILPNIGHTPPLECGRVLAEIIRQKTLEWG
jgi:pimeloyl-ACP methyl ester carboxylesterase